MSYVKRMNENRSQVEFKGRGRTKVYEKDTKEGVGTKERRLQIGAIVS